MSGHYIICGFGRMGQQIVRDLERQGVPHVVVENNPEQIPRLQARGVPYVEGKASEDEVLLRAGVERAKGLIAVAASDEENVFIVLTARGLNPNLMIIARSILEANEDKLRRAGADRVISPYILGGRRMAAEVTRRGVVDFLDLILHGDTHNVDIVHLVVPPGSPLVGRTLAELGVWQRCGVTVLATQLPSGEMTANPCPETRLADAMELIVMGNPEQVARARALLEGSAEGVAAAPSDQS
ncbi:MAG: NAD-binding protein [Armatimonadota bacterium]|nr:NAD-binding protein [Armatimonadota bacterium]